MKRVRMAAVLALGLVVFAGVRAADEPKTEAGFTALFNGKDFTGWKQQKDSVSLDGKDEAYGKRFIIKDSAIVIDPKVKGDVHIETAKEFSGDVVLKLDFKPGSGCNNDLFFRGSKFDIKSDKGVVVGLKVDEWNKLEMTVTGDQVVYKINGEAQKALKATAPKSTFRIRAEFGPIEIKGVSIKEVKK